MVILHIFVIFVCLQCPTVISDETPVERVIELLRKMGLRQVLVTKNGYENWNESGCGNGIKYGNGNGPET